jgi:hypothetical protein
VSSGPKLNGSAIALSLVLMHAVALGQSPVEERRAPANSLFDAQQRVEFSRKAAEQADSGLRDAERDLRLANAGIESAQQQVQRARARAEQSRKNLAQARARAVEARSLHERESAQYDRLRRGAP